VCVDNRCERRTVTAPEQDAGTDAGMEMDAGTDAGMEMDAGTDAGMEMDAGTDAGMEMDAGMDAGMNVEQGGACLESANCMAGLRCEQSGDTRKCEPLHVAVTTGLSDGGTEAVAVRYNATANAPFELSETDGMSRYPRWSANGNAVAFVEEQTAGSPVLVRRDLPLVPAQKQTLATGSAEKTKDFRHLEWEPSGWLAWTQVAPNNSVSGISVVDGSSGNVQAGTNKGGYPSWSADGQSFVYSIKTEGLRIHPLTGTETVAFSDPEAEQGLYNKANNWLLFLDNDGAEDTFGTDAVPLMKLKAVSADGGDAKLIADVSTQAITGGELKSFIANHTWAPVGTHAAYVRVYYFKPPTGSSILCGNTGALCPQGQAANVIFVQRINPVTGEPEGPAMELATEATLPSFSPDGHFIAYLSGGKLVIQRINPEAADASTLKVDGGFFKHDKSGPVRSNMGDDHRPRWQPR
jgi:Tol biopolymer transport system component